MQDTLAFDDRGSLGRHGWIGLLAIFGLFGGLAWWASVVEIDGAIVASGSVIVETYPKRVQHQEGGTVAEFFVRNEDHVEGGQILVRLDSTAIAASLAVLKSQWSEALVREARLIAEIGGAPSFTLPQALATATPDPQIAALFALERQVSSARLTAKAGQAAQIARADRPARDANFRPRNAAEGRRRATRYPAAGNRRSNRPTRAGPDREQSCHHLGQTAGAARRCPRSVGS